MGNIRCPHCERQMREAIEQTSSSIQTFQCSHCSTTVARIQNQDGGGSLHTDIVNKPQINKSATED